jgi:hydroxymethylpyrimidine/phosphomethylpyrimidine kinase
VVTPNLDEAALLLGQPLTDAAALEPAAQALLALGARAALLKGGHLAGDEVADLLARPCLPTLRLASPRIASRNVHGTGCTLSSAIAAHLALGHGLDEAVRRARHYILGAIAAGAEVQTGGGHGPLNHGHAPVPTHLLEGLQAA